LNDGGLQLLVRGERPSVALFGLGQIFAQPSNIFFELFNKVGYLGLSVRRRFFVLLVIGDVGCLIGNLLPCGGRAATVAFAQSVQIIFMGIFQLDSFGG
jgi:hypothetical protein